ncbi:MAG: molybdenum cofactor biosynthesis protein B [Candidatus Methylomirabilales bacterium]
MGVKDHREAAAQATELACAVLTVSDSRSEADDESGKAIRERLTAAGFRVTRYRLLRNDLPAIQDEVMSLVESRIACVVLTGGTGLGQRDVTVEALTPILDKRLNGFGEIFRSLSFAEVGPAAIMSRALGGLARRTLIFALPGSTAAVTLALERLILPELKHLVREARR